MHAPGIARSGGADDVTIPVDTKDIRREGARNVNDREAALVEKKTMGSPGRVIIVTHDVPQRVDSDGDRGYGSRRVNNGLEEPSWSRKPWVPPAEVLQSPT